MKGDAAVVMMADESDDCRDVVRYWQTPNEDWDCVFGSRFLKGGGVIDYPWVKLQVNRLANAFLRLLFNISFNDTTNAFKAYRRTVIAGVQPTALPECIFDLSLDPITENGKRRNHGRTDPFSATNTGSATRSGEFGRTHLTFMVRTAIFINFLIAESCLAVA